MNIKALITMLVLGSSSVAMARPVTVTGHAGASIVVRDHRAPRDHRADLESCEPARAPVGQPTYEGSLQTPPPFVPVWAVLGTESRIMDGIMSFGVSPHLRGRAFSMLKLQTSAGKSLINRVEIKFANGRTQIVELNKYLNAKNPMIVIDLDGDWARSIRNVTVVGKNARQSAYSVLAI